jgi:hypothetical protein
MRNKSPVIVLVLFLVGLALNACTPAADGATETVEILSTDVTPEGTIDMEVVVARDAAFATISEHYGEQAPRPDLAWITEDVTPDGQNSPVFQYSAEDWVVTASCLVVIPDGCAYHVKVINETTGFRWEGEVDTGGGVTEKPTREPVKSSEWVLAARDAALAYLADQYGDQAPPLGLTWRGAYTTPEGWVGSGDWKFTAGDWVIAISYPIVPPERTVYQVTVTNQMTGFQWEGKVDATGEVTQWSTFRGNGEQTGCLFKSLAPSSDPTTRTWSSARRLNTAVMQAYSLAGLTGWAIGMSRSANRCDGACAQGPWRCPSQGGPTPALNSSTLGPPRRRNSQLP